MVKGFKAELFTVYFHKTENNFPVKAFRQPSRNLGVF
jgi:hypothetical protein